MRKDVEFKTQDGVTLKAWHYLPDRRSGKVPTIVMAHGFSAVKEMYLDKFAEVFATAGLGALVFDNRISARAAESRARKSTLGAGPRLPRCDHVRGDASGADADRIGIWGSSYGGGHG